MGFEELYDAMTKWAIGPENTSLGYNDFAAAELKQANPDSVTALKFKTDRIV